MKQKLLSRVWLFAAPWTICSLWNSPGQNTGVGSLSLLQGIFPTQESGGRFFTIWATREAQETGVGSLSFLKGIFPTQESKWGLLHCRRNFYQLSYKGSTGRSPGEGNGNLLQYSCLENPMNRGGWWATVYGITKSQTCMQSHRAAIRRNKDING